MPPLLKGGFSSFYINTTMLTITTCTTYPQPPKNLLSLQQYLIEHGTPTDFAPWQSTENRRYILPLCAWDYANFYENFTAWIGRNHAAFINSAELMLWNSHKSYLCDLQKQSINVIPTELCVAKTTEISTALSRLFRHYEEIVLKPAVGQSGNLVTKLKQGDPLPNFTKYGEQIVLQPFISEIQSSGEISLIFFNGTFSHAIRRQPAKNDWRANSQYQVEISAVDVVENIIAAASNTLATLPEMPVYARVDGTIIQCEFLLNELELIEPALYLDKVEGATERFGQAIFAKIQTIR